MERPGEVHLDASPHPDHPPGGMALLDVDRDGRLEVAVQGGLYRYIEDWGFRKESIDSCDPRGYLRDLAGGGRIGTVRTDIDAGTITVRDAIARGEERVFPAGDSPAAVTALDLDGDGRLDLAVANFDSGLVTVLLQRVVVPATSEDLDGDGVPDECAGLPRFIRGDSNADGAVDLSDAVYTLLHLFAGGPPPSCLKAASLDGRTVDLSSVIGTLEVLFTGQAAFKPPFPGCGVEPDLPGGLSCDRFPPCP